jgi:hypothetical protein
MATNRDLLKEAIADAKAVKETAIANAKAALEEAFTPYLKEKLSAKLAEMENDEMEEEMYEADETMDEVKMEAEAMEMDEISLDELLAELEEESDMDENYMEEELYEAKEEEEEMSIEDMDEDDLKSFIEDVIKDMVSAGELEAGHEGMENEEGAEEEGEEMEMGDEEEMEADEEEIDEEINIDELLAEMEMSKEENLEESAIDVLTQFAQDLQGGDDLINKTSAALAGTGIALSTVLLALKDKAFRTELIAAAKEDLGKLKDFIVSKFKGNKPATPEKSEMDEQLAELRSELNEVNLLNAKLLYTNKIFRNKSLNETQKVKVLTAFDKATSKKEVELVYETLLESLKVTTKAPIKESMGSASKVLGSATSKPIIENDAFARMRELAFGNKK